MIFIEICMFYALLVCVFMFLKVEKLLLSIWRKIMFFLNLKKVLAKNR